MERRDFWKLILASAFIASGLLFFLLRWTAPPSSRAALTEAPEGPVTLTEEERINTQLYESLSPGVVNVTATSIELDWFLQPVPRAGSGSGFLIDEQGHIVTNYHVIEKVDRLEVTLHDKSRHQARVVGADPVNDLAVLKIDCPRTRCRPLKLGSSRSLRVGQKVLAIGNPFGLEHTLTSGIISSVGRELETRYGIMDELIQTDAAINPGNSGGPLLNLRGEVIGVNTAIYSESGGSIGIGFAVPTATLSRIVPDLIEHGEVQRPWFGIRGQALSPQLAEALELPVESGFVVWQVEPGSSAERAGIRGGTRRAFFGNFPIVIGGDVIVSLAGMPVKTANDLSRILEARRPGEQVEIIFYRGNEKIQKKITLVARSRTPTFRF
ncbi:MAG: trypsin-like peptidase domain-containing protein [Acidobacteria bacterium]|nr:trypsin-like peptidase domain-containing protein [Acidobacteriota bacterium]